MWKADGPFGHNIESCTSLHELVDRQMLDSDGTGRGTYYFIPGRHPVGNPALSLDEQTDTGSDAEVQHLPSEVQHLEKLKTISRPISSAGKSDKEAVREAIIRMCRIQELPCTQIAELLNRKEQTMQNHYLDKMCDEGLLKREFPVKHHPKQRCRAE